MQHNTIPGQVRRAAIVAALNAAAAEHAEALQASAHDHSDEAARRLTHAELILAQRCEQAAPLYRPGSPTQTIMRVAAVYLNASVSSRKRGA